MEERQSFSPGQIVNVSGPRFKKMGNDRMGIIIEIDESNKEIALVMFPNSKLVRIEVKLLTKFE
jgi:hypothetical protein|tara:strand:- start:921 stop:1112 length:192 start_codon:yes stop_codon:yes gene_type:complete